MDLMKALKGNYMLSRQKAFIVPNTSKIYNGREIGLSVRGQLLKYLDELPVDSIVPIDFSDIKFMDFSCADEFITKILLRIRSGELENRFIILCNLTSSVHENIDAVLKVRKLVCPIENKDGTIGILGELNTGLFETYMIAIQKGKITARDITDSGLSISSASNRLIKLQNLGLLCRIGDEVVSGGGRQYIYEPVA